MGPSMVTSGGRGNIGSTGVMPKESADGSADAAGILKGARVGKARFVRDLGRQNRGQLQGERIVLRMERLGRAGARDNRGDRRPARRSQRSELVNS